MPIAIGPDGPPLILDRRRALLAMASLGASAVMGCSHRAGSRGNADGWFAFLSDPHVASDPSARLRGEVMADNLQAVVADILHGDDPPQGVLIDGDLAFHHGEPGDYATLLGVLDPLRRQGLPVHMTLGNHDDRDHVLAALPDRPRIGPEAKAASVVEGPGLRFLLLDSQNGVNVTAGRLGDDQIAWVARELDDHPQTPAVVFVHHNLNAQSDSALKDTAGLLDVLAPRRQAKAVFFGHTHVWNVRKIGDLHAVNLPAIGYRFLPKQPLGWVVFRPRPDGAELELRCIGGDRRQDGRRVDLSWRRS